MAAKFEEIVYKISVGDFIDIDHFKMGADEQYLLVVSVICGECVYVI